MDFHAHEAEILKKMVELFNLATEPIIFMEADGELHSFTRWIDPEAKELYYKLQGILREMNQP